MNSSDSVKQLLQDITVPTEQRTSQAIITEAAPANNPVAASPVEATPEPKAEASAQQYTDDQLEASSDMVISMVDLAQQNIFRFFAKRKRKSRLVDEGGSDALKRLSELQKKLALYQQQAKQPGVTDIPQMDEKDIAILSINQEIEDFIEDLPIKDYERDTIRPHLMHVMKKHGGNMPPEMWLLLGCMTIAGARLGELSSI